MGYKAVRSRHHKPKLWWRENTATVYDELFAYIRYLPTTGKYKVLTPDFYTTGNEYDTREQAVTAIEAMFALELE